MQDFVHQQYHSQVKPEYKSNTSEEAEPKRRVNDTANAACALGCLQNNLSCVATAHHQNPKPSTQLNKLLNPCMTFKPQPPRTSHPESSRYVKARLFEIMRVRLWGILQ